MVNTFLAGYRLALYSAARGNSYSVSIYCNTQFTQVQDGLFACAQTCSVCVCKEGGCYTSTMVSFNIYF